VLGLLTSAAEARTLTVSAERLQNSAASASGITVIVREQADGDAFDLEIRQVEVPMLALSGRIAWQCELRQTGDSARACSGPVRLRSADGSVQDAQLSADVAKDRIDLELARDETRVRIALPLGGNAPTQLALAHVPAAWLRASLARAWPKGELRRGSLDGELNLRDGGVIDGRYEIADFTANTADGALSGDGVGAAGTFRIDDVSTAPHVLVDATLTAGALRFGDVRVDLPDTPVELTLDAVAANEGSWTIRNIAWRDAGTLEFAASCVFAPSTPDPLRELAVHIDRAVFPLAMRRYAAGVLAARGLGSLSVKGDLSGDFSLGAAGLDRIAMSFDGFDLADGERFSVRGVNGAVDWSAKEDRPPTRLRWKNAQFGTLALGSGNAQLRTRNGIIELGGPMSIALFNGSLDLKQLAFDPRMSGGLNARAEFGLRKIGYDSADGTIAAAGVTAEGTLQLSGTAQAPQVQLLTTFHGGELLYGPFYVKLPATPVRSTAEASFADTRWQVQRFDWNDPGVLEIGGDADIAPSAARPLSAIHLEVRRVALAPALDRYARSWLASKGYGELGADGEVSGSLKFDGHGLQHFAFAAKEVGLRDGAGRFTFAGVDGGVDWRHGDEGPPTSLSWKAIELFRIPLGAATAQFRSQDQAITLVQPVAVDVLGGSVRLERLSLEPRSPRGERYAGSFAIAGIDMAQLSAAFGWPRFGGSLSGGIPEIEFSGDTIELHGGLDLYVFDGYLGISGMTLERPFGIAPSLRSDIHFENFDLEKLTSAFSFGGMSGRLDGNVSGLRLVDWSPVAFDAALRANGGGRMSYKAVNDLTALGGGGGLSSSLQTMALQVFDTFGYRRLGIRCRLANEVCAMGGVDAASAPAGSTETGSAGDSYTIVEGSGLPRIQIIGHRRKVDWPTLVERLIEATRGQGPVIK